MVEEKMFCVITTKNNTTSKFSKSEANYTANEQQKQLERRYLRANSFKYHGFKEPDTALCWVPAPNTAS